MSWKFNPFTGTLDQTGADPTPETVVEYPADEDISAMKVVYKTPTGVALADSQVSGKERAIGLSLNAANAGDIVSVKLFGQVSDSIFSAFALNDLLFLSSAGALTATVPPSGFRVAVGTCLGSNEFLVDIGEIITR